MSKPLAKLPGRPWLMVQAIIWLIVLYGCISLLAGCQAPLRTNF